jgi:MFS family permease
MNAASIGSIPAAGTAPRPGYGWVIAGSMLLLLALVNGLTLAGVSVFDDTLLRELHVSVGALKFRDLLGLACSGVAAPFIGRAVDRIGVRPVIGFGLALIAVSMLLYSGVHAIWHVYAIHVLLGVAFAATNIVVIMVLLAQWFEARRGVALGIVLSGTSIGGTIFPPLVAALIAHFGWHDAFRLLAIVPVLYVPVLLLLIRERPLTGVAPPAAGEAPAATGPGFFALARSREFLMLALVAIAVFYAANTFIRHSFLFLKLGGASVTVAAAGISTVYLFGLIGKILSGLSLEAISIRWVLATCEALTIAGALVLIGAGSTHATIAFALIGLGWGGGYTLVQLAAARYFAGPGLGRLLGGFVVIESLSQGMGSFLSGILHDIGGSYALPFGLVLVLMVGALIATLSADAFRIPARRA